MDLFPSPAGCVLGLPPKAPVEQGVPPVAQPLPVGAVIGFVFTLLATLSGFHCCHDAAATATAVAAIVGAGTAAGLLSLLGLTLDSKGAMPVLRGAVAGGGLGFLLCSSIPLALLGLGALSLLCQAGRRSIQTAIP